MSITWLQTLVLALIQGVTELFPISSLGHTVIIPGLLGWTALVQIPQFLPVIVAFHLGTSIALVLSFWQDWWRVLQTLVQSIQQGQVKQGDASWVSWLVIIGCIPVGLLEVALEKPLKHLFSSPLIAALFLLVNGMLLLLGEWLRRSLPTAHKSLDNAWGSVSGQAIPQLGLPPGKRTALGLPAHAWDERRLAAAETVPFPQVSAPVGQASRPLTSLTWKEALVVGLAQALTLLPGISRSGTTMVVGLAVGLSHEDAAHYAFPALNTLNCCGGLVGNPAVGRGSRGNHRSHCRWHGPFWVGSLCEYRMRNAVL